MIPCVAPPPVPESTEPAGPRLSIVIPVLNEAEHLPRLLSDLAPLRAQGCEIIVVDGGSRDATLAAAATGADQVLQGPRGRALQMNAGAARARGAVVWFLHADTRVPAAVPAALPDPDQGAWSWGRCGVRLSGDRLAFRLIGGLMNLRSCLTGIATGDQGIFVRRAAFVRVGGFPELALMEDIALSRRLKQTFGRPCCLRAQLITSSRRWEAGGVGRTVLLMWSLRLAYWAGADPAALAQRYRAGTPAPGDS